MELINISKNCILTRNHIGFKAVMSKIPLNQLNKNTSSNILLSLLDVARVSNNGEMVRDILEVFSSVSEKYTNQEFYNCDNEQNEPRQETNYLEYLIDLIKEGVITRLHKEIFKFIVESLIEITYVDLAQNVLSFGPTVLANEALALIDFAFPKVSDDEIKLLYSLLTDKATEDNDYFGSTLYAYTVKKYEQISDYADIPVWIDSFVDPKPTEDECLEYADEHEEQTQKLVDSKFLDWTKGQMVDQYIEYLKDANNDEETLEKVRAALTVQYDNMTDEQWHDELNRFIYVEYNKFVYTDINFFRWLGPANPLQIDGRDYDSGTIDSEFGGCRMFISEHYDYNEDDMIYDDWFRGACDSCHKRIRQRHHAVRMPIPSGGWQGCYCSCLCLRNNEKIMEDSPVIFALIDKYENMLVQLKIQETAPTITSND